MALTWWKLRRECSRIRSQLGDALGTVTESWRQRRYDAHREERLLMQHGAVEQRDKVALLLIYQTGGVAESVLVTCRHLMEKGYAPLVVSNTPLSQVDQARLKPVCWRLLQRPNFGYDFGGYRDGIWMLEREHICPQKLLILNDSIWFPTHAGERLLEQLETDSADVCGALAAEDRRSRQQTGRARRCFLSSFMLMVQRTTLERKGFWRFWAVYACSNSKQRTIRQGERGFSMAMGDQEQLNLGAVQRRVQLDALIDRAEPDTLANLLGGLVTLDAALIARRDDCLKAPLRDTAWLNEARGLMREFTDGQNYLSTAPLMCLQQLGVPYVKKSRDPQNLAALKQIVASAEAGQLALHPVILQELKQIVGTG